MEKSGRFYNKMEKSGKKWRFLSGAEVVKSGMCGEPGMVQPLRGSALRRSAVALRTFCKVYHVHLSSHFLMCERERESSPPCR